MNSANMRFRIITIYFQVKIFCDKGAERKLRDEERRAAKRRMTPSGKRRLDEMYHETFDRWKRRARVHRYLLYWVCWQWQRKYNKSFWAPGLLVSIHLWWWIKYCPLAQHAIYTDQQKYCYNVNWKIFLSLQVWVLLNEWYEQTSNIVYTPWGKC